MSLLAFIVAATVLAVTPRPGIADVVAVFAADCLLGAGAGRAARARSLTGVPGLAPPGLGATLVLVRREVRIRFAPIER